MDHHGHDHAHHMVESNSTIGHTMGGAEHHMHMDHGALHAEVMNHSGMDHGGMDHRGMDHGGMSHMMKMYFHFSLGDVVLFDIWKVDTYGSLIVSMIIIFAVAMCYEGLKYFREYLYWKNYNKLHYQTVNKPPAPETERVINKPTLLSPHHLIQTALHILQITVSYLLMLIFMTYNVWLCIAVVVGSATGYFLFGWRKSLFLDVTEHCH